MLKVCPINLNLTKCSAQNSLWLPVFFPVASLWAILLSFCEVKIEGNLSSESQDLFELCFSTPVLEQAEQCALNSLLIYVNNLHMFFKKN